MNNAVNEIVFPRGFNFHIDEEIIKEISPIYRLSQSPLPLRRPRLFKRGVYDSQKQEKLMIGLHLKRQHGDLPPYDGILHLNIYFFFPFPKDPKQKNNLKKQHFHTYRPDLSNLLKMIEDVCVDSEIITDDSRISSSFSFKVYDDKPSTGFQIISIKGRV